VTIHYPPTPTDGATMATDKNDSYYNFTITNETEVSIHNIHTGFLPYKIGENNQDIFNVKLDVTLSDYFNKVMALATDEYGYPIRIADDHEK
jgi:hypothetical protein